jgi:hypothetical protein
LPMVLAPRLSVPLQSPSLHSNGASSLLLLQLGMGKGCGGGSQEKNYHCQCRRRHN